MSDDGSVVEERDGYRVRLVSMGEDPGDSPRDDEGDLGTLVLKHGRYILPFEGDLTSEIDRGLTEYGYATVARWLKVFHGATVVLPVYGYEHGSLRLRAADEPAYPFTDRWDTGYAGLIYDTPASREECGTQPEDIAQSLAGEVASYDAWFNGEVYAYVVEQFDGRGDDGFGDWDELERVGGFYSTEEATQEGVASLEAHLLTVAEAKRNRRKSMLTRELARTRDTQAHARELLNAADRGVAQTYAALAEIDPDHPLYVAPDAPHWHVERHREDDDVFTASSVFDALEYAAEELKRVADFEADSVPGWNDHLGFQQMADAMQRSERFANLAENAAKVAGNAGLPWWDRSPIYAVEGDEPGNRARLLTAATHQVARINRNGPGAFAVWECKDTRAVCELVNDDDETGA